MTEAIMKELLTHGTTGILAIIAMYVAWKKDQALSAERDARLADQKEMLKMYYALAQESESTLETAVNLIVQKSKTKDA